jgi:hypothetical protein
MASITLTIPSRTAVCMSKDWAGCLHQNANADDGDEGHGHTAD